MKLALVVALGWSGLLAADTLPPWLDSISRIGVVGILALALLGLHRKWWVPGWAYRELDERCSTLSDRYDAAIEIALASSNGVQRSATALEQALAAAAAARERQG